MVKTQIQLPDGLYRDLKRLAAQKEWSLAETLRRAAEQFLARHASSTPASSRWTPPVSASAGWRGLTPEQLRELALDDMEGHVKPAPTREAAVAASRRSRRA
jgi:hypothetical protein